MHEELTKSLKTVKEGGTICYATETAWSIGCDATNYEAIEKIYQLKKQEKPTEIICLVSDFRMLNSYVEHIPEVAYDILKYAVRPTTIIYDNPIKISENLVAEDNTLAIRVTKNRFCKDLIKKLRKPLVAIPANSAGITAPKSYSEIHTDILKGVDYVVNLHKNKKMMQPEAIIKLNKDGMVQVIKN